MRRRTCRLAVRSQYKILPWPRKRFSKRSSSRTSTRPMNLVLQERVPVRAWQRYRHRIDRSDQQNSSTPPLSVPSPTVLFLLFDYALAWNASPSQQDQEGRVQDRERDRLLVLLLVLRLLTMKSVWALVACFVLLTFESCNSRSSTPLDQDQQQVQDRAPDLLRDQPLVDPSVYLWRRLRVIELLLLLRRLVVLLVVLLLLLRLRLQRSVWVLRLFIAALLTFPVAISGPRKRKTRKLQTSNSICGWWPCSVCPTLFLWSCGHG
jgi:hypothetical protein